MVVFINGSFGVGKTTVTRILARRIPKSRVLNPEIIGFVLKHGKRLLFRTERQMEDFQNIILWRTLVIWSIVALSKMQRGIILVPMTFSNLEYLNEIRFAVCERDIEVKHFCLIASVKIITERLAKRGTSRDSEEGRWIHARISQCCRIHQTPDFAEQIDTSNRTPQEIAHLLANKIISTALF